MLSVSTLQIPVGEPNFFSKGFRQLIEDHIFALRSDTTTQIVTLKAQDENKYIGDFYGLLLTYNITQDMFWITMRVNNLHSPTDYSGDLKYILKPSRSIIVGLLTTFYNSITIQ